MADAFATGDVEATCQILKGADAGKAWIASFQESAEPWFNFSTGSGFYHSDKIWIENVEIPFDFINNYIGMLKEGEDLARPMEAIRAERDRIVSEYADLLDRDAEREAFQGKLGLARVVFPYVENHNFYVEHWSHSVIWRKMRQLGELFVKEGFWAERERHLLPQAQRGRGRAVGLLRLVGHSGCQAAGPGYWPPEIERRRAILAALPRGSRPPRWACRRRSSPSPSRSCSGASPRTSTKAWLGGGEGEDGALRAWPPRPAWWRARPA